MGAQTIAVIMTVHNRRVTTLACLEALFGQQDVSCTPDVYVVDDGSTDGTSEAIVHAFPAVNIIAGDGTYFWAKGMAVAESHACAADPDLLLWLNDDVVMDRDGLYRLLEVQNRHPDAVIVGAMRHPITGELTYGGRYRPGRIPQRFAQLPLADQIQTCESFHGNCVLIPRSVRRKVGHIDGDYPHGYADDDYGLRCTELGTAIVQVPGSIGTCPPNPSAATQGGPLKRWRAMQDRKAGPLRAQVRFLRRHGGRLWWAWVVAIHAKGAMLGFRSHRV